MCRILLVRSAIPLSMHDELVAFAELSRNSREYQGHGWGCSWLAKPSMANTSPAAWQHYHSIKPVWEDNLTQFSTASLLMVHARSAFRDEGIAVENNMPFTDGESVFIFNGELRGVKIKSEGRIGAEKIYNYFRRMDKGDKHLALEKSVSIINKRTTYVRAMNIILSDGQTSLVSSSYNEDPDYFQMHHSENNGVMRVCSVPYGEQRNWQRLSNNTTRVL